MVVTRQPITVLLADPSDLSRFGLRTLLQGDHRFEVIGDIPIDVVGAAQRLQPDVIVVDPARDGDLDLRIIDELHRVAPNSRLVILTAAFEPQSFMTAMLKRVHACVLKDSGLQAALLVETLTLVARFGVVVVDAAIAEHFWALPGTPGSGAWIAPTAPVLTERQLEVLRDLAAGFTEERIAAAEGTSTRSIRRAITDLELKLDAASLFSLGARAAQLRLIE